MKKTILFIVLIFANLNFAQNVNIPDANFKNALLAHGVTITAYDISKIDVNSDGEIQVSEAEAYTGAINVGNKGLVDLTGIEAFVNIKSLNCWNNQLTSLDVSKNTALKYLILDKNKVSILDTSKNVDLIGLSAGENKLTYLNVTKNLVLSSLTCGYNQLANLDVSQNSNLSTLECHVNPLTSLNVRQNTKLFSLSVYNSQLTSLDLSQNLALQFLSCHYSNIAQLDVTLNKLLKKLSCGGSDQMIDLDITHNLDLTELRVSFTAITSLNLTKNTALTHLYCNNNQILNLDVSQNKALKVVSCGYNKLSNLDIAQNVNLLTLYCGDNQLTELNVDNQVVLQDLDCKNNKLMSLNLTNNLALTSFACYNNLLTTLNVANGKNNKITSFYATLNPNLTCIQIDNGFTPPNNWRKDATASYSTNCALSTDNFELSNQFTVYPNPVNTILNIQNEEGIAVKNYTVLDANGRVLMKPSQEIQSNQINLTGLTPGIYFIQLETDKGVAVKRIIKE